MGYVVRPAREETRSFAPAAESGGGPGEPREGWGPRRALAAGGHARSSARALSRRRAEPRGPSCRDAEAPACREARRRRPSGGRARLRGRCSRRRAGRRTRGPGTASVPPPARYGGRRASGRPVCARAGGQSATGRGVLRGPAALAFGRLGCRHPDSISPESVAGLRPGGSANVMFV